MCQLFSVNTTSQLNFVFNKLKNLFSQNKNDKYNIFVVKNILEKPKTNIQCAFFHSLLEEFVKKGQEFSIEPVCNYNIGWWKFQIKKLAQFYDTKKGCVFTTERAKEIYYEIKKLPKDIQEDLIEAMTMNTKSIRNATTKELNVLITKLIELIIIYFNQDIINSSEFLSKTIEDLRNNEFFLNDLNNQELIDLINEKFKKN